MSYEPSPLEPAEFVEVQIPVSQLMLDEENFRIEEVASQREAIFSMLREQNNGEKILRLATHIVDHGTLAPGERLYVIPNDISEDQSDSEPDLFVVMDGNRRTIALKVLENPQMIREEFPSLYKRFAELSDRVPTHLLQFVPCILLPDRDTALEWVELRHSTDLEGVGLEKWGAEATARFAERKGRYRRWRIALGRLESVGISTSDISKDITGKTSAVERVLGSAAIRDRLGVRFHNQTGMVEFENGDDEAGVKLLATLMTAMSGQDFRTASVHALEDRRRFIEQFVELSVRDMRGEVWHGEGSATSATIEKPASTDSDEDLSRRTQGPRGTEQESATPTVPNRRTVGVRQYLAPGDPRSRLDVKDPILTEFYRELMRLTVNRLERVAVISTRVFIELSCDAYLKELSISPPRHISAKPNGWLDASLREKLQAVVKDIDPKNQERELDQVRKVLGNDDWLHSIDSLHDLVHNRFATISAREARQIWDRYQPFLKRLYERIDRSTT